MHGAYAYAIYMLRDYSVEEEEEGKGLFVNYTIKMHFLKIC